MKVKITSPTRVSGRHLEEGRILAVADEDGAILLAANKAVRFVDFPKVDPPKDGPEPPAAS